MRDMGPMVARCPWILSQSALDNIPAVVAGLAEAKVCPWRPLLPFQCILCTVARVYCLAITGMCCSCLS